MITEQIIADLYKQIRDFQNLNSAMADALHISNTEFEILYYIGFFGEGCTQKEICNYTNISKSSINSAIKKMIREGNLYIVHSEGRKDLYLTETGRKLVRENIDPYVTVQLETIEDMKEEAEQMMNSLKKYIELFEDKAGSYEG